MSSRSKIVKTRLVLRRVNTFFGARASAAILVTSRPHPVFSSVRLVADDLGKRFGRRILFRGLSATFEGGDRIAITGANGAGKSTLLRLLAGVLTPSKGAVALYVDGEPLAPERHPLCIGFVAPYLNVYDGFSPRENLRFIADARRLPDAQQRIAAALADVDLVERADDLVATFSSGMKQRVKFAAAMVSAPSVLLLDEPSVNLDAPGLAMVVRTVARQRDRGGIVLVATNDPDEAARYDREIRIEDYR